MPIMNGIETLKKVKEKYWLTNERILSQKCSFDKLIDDPGDLRRIVVMRPMICYYS